MRGRRHKLQVSTFPFLAVLLCAMGSLILVLLVMDRKAHQAAQARAQREAAQLAEKSAQNVAAAQAEKEQKRQSLHAKLTKEQIELQMQIKKVRAEFSTIAARLRYEQDANTQLRHKVQDQRDREKSERQALAALRGSAELAGTHAKESGKSLERMTADLLRMEQALKDLRAARERQQHTFSVVPYHGRRGENRRPIYVECTAEGVVFHPERRAMPVTAREILLGRDRPEDVPDDVRAEVQRRIARQRGQQGGAANTTPYLLLLVRPDGINTYTQFQAVLRDMPLEFGYEFIDADWVLDFPSEDDQPRAQPWMTAANPSAPAAPSTSSTTTVNPRPVHLSPSLAAGPTPAGRAGAAGAAFRFGPAGPPGASGGGAGPPRPRGYAGNLIGGSYPGGGGTGSARGPGRGHPSAMAPTAEGEGDGSGASDGDGGPVGGNGGSGTFVFRGGTRTSGAGSSGSGSPGAYGPAAAGLGTPRALGASPSGMGHSGGSGSGQTQPGASGLNGSGSSGNGSVVGGNAVASSNSSGVGRGGVSGSPRPGLQGLNGSGSSGSGLAVGSNLQGSSSIPGTAPNGRYAVARGNGGSSGADQSSGDRLGTGVGSLPSGGGLGGAASVSERAGQPLPYGGGSNGPGTGTGPLPNGRGSASGSRSGAGQYPFADGGGSGGAATVREQVGQALPYGRGSDAAVRAGQPLPDGRGTDGAASVPGGVPSNGDNSSRVVVIDDPLLPKSAAPVRPAEPPPDGQFRDPPPQETNRNRGPPAVRYIVGNRGSGEPGEPGSEALSRFAPPTVEASRKPRPAALHPAWVHGGRDWVIYVECLSNGVVLYPSGRAFTLAQASSEASVNPLAAALKQMIERRQASRRPGEPPYYPEVRLLVRPENVRTFLAVYPTLDAVPAPKTKRNLGPEDSVADIVRGVNP